MDKEFITICKFSNLQEAELAKGLLEAYEIPVLLIGQNSAALNYLRYTTVEEIQLQVPEDKKEQSLELLQSEVTLLTEDHFPEEADEDISLQKIKKARQKSIAKILIAMILLGLLMQGLWMIRRYG